ncbi:hypothetical protein PR048_015712 [Dryococelus australis]|uniref:DDE Tnp4 domain-containing protein n=1 Tax=Dryococelus australis TaxID=614101 RepID=A0ABQ9HHP8_9NEOP|nr:hypothetical protein PR048_015712 [Dryococelus australis]
MAHPTTPSSPPPPSLKSLPRINCALPHVIVGDGAFPLLENVMTPYPGVQLANDESKKIYNYRHSRARRVSENTFGMLSKKFRIFFKKNSHLVIIVLAITVPHNYLRDDACAWQIGELEHEGVPQAFGNLRGTGGDIPKRAFNVREYFRNYFISPREVFHGKESVFTMDSSTTNEAF